MYKIAVMGEYDSIYGFATLGLTLFSTDGKTDEEASRLLSTAAESGFGVIYMTEALMNRIPREVARYQARLTPAIIAIPGVAGNTGAGIANVKKSVEQAVGSDILFSNS